MTREYFGQQLERLERETLDLGYVVAAQPPVAIAAILRRDSLALEEIVARDRRINTERLAIEGQAIALIATQQPVAVDMRLLASLLEMAGEIERMGDYAKGIARIGLRIGGSPVPPSIARAIVTMGDRCDAMLRRALNAFAARDPAAAREIISEDDVIDRLYQEVFANVMSLGAPDATQMEQSNYYLWIAHDLERTADRITNVCERTIYVVTGSLAAEHRSAMEARLSTVAEGTRDTAASRPTDAPPE